MPGFSSSTTKSTMRLRPYSTASGDLVSFVCNEASTSTLVSKHGTPEYYITWKGPSWESSHPSRPEVDYYCRLGFWNCVTCQDNDSSAADSPIIDTPVMGHDTAHILTTYLKHGPRFQPSLEHPDIELNMKSTTRRVIVRLRDNSLDWDAELAKCVDDEAREKSKSRELARLAECGGDNMPAVDFIPRERLSPQWLSRAISCNIGSLRLSWEVGSTVSSLSTRGTGCEDCWRERRERREGQSQGLGNDNPADSDDDPESEYGTDSDDDENADESTGPDDDTVPGSDVSSDVSPSGSAAVPDDAHSDHHTGASNDEGGRELAGVFAKAATIRDED